MEEQIKRADFKIFLWYQETPNFGLFLGINTLSGEFYLESANPLANLLRPQTLKDFVGQNRIIGLNSPVTNCLKSGRLSNFILWGPPGCGKTSLALLLGKEFNSEFISLNAVEVGAKGLRDLGEQAHLNRQLYQKQTIVFIDEIHRLNKSQQDILLPFIEKGDFVLMGATTENPSYELNRALMSRCHLLVFEALKDQDLTLLWHRSLATLNITQPIVNEKGLQYLCSVADGDARRFLNMVELIALSVEQAPPKDPLGVEDLVSLLPKQCMAYDKSADSHYDTISAFIKSLRGSDPDAAMYYLARMIQGGEDPEFIARRLVIFASEDVGNADPRALQVAVAGAEAVKMIGLPECGINLSQVVTYLASAPKSNRSYRAWLKAKAFVESHPAPPIPLHLRSSKTSEMKKLGYGVGYKYPHDWPAAWVEQEHLPEGVQREIFYEPSDRGFEKNIRDYSLWIRGKQGLESKK